MHPKKLRMLVSALRSSTVAGKKDLLARLNKRLAALRSSPQADKPKSEWILRTNDVGIRLIDVGKPTEHVDKLVAKMYQQRGYKTGSSTTTSNEVLEHPRRITLEACRDNKTVGTITVALDGPGGLNAEELHPDEIRPYRRPGASLCEFTRLALDMDRCGKEALGRLYHLAVIFAYRIHDATDLFIEVNPRHSLFYRRKLGFEVIGKEKICQRVNAPALLLHQRLSSISEQIIRYGGLRIHQNKSFYAFFMPPWEETELLAELKTRLSNWPASDIDLDFDSAAA